MIGKEDGGDDDGPIDGPGIIPINPISGRRVASWQESERHENPASRWSGDGAWGKAMSAARMSGSIAGPVLGRTQSIGQVGMSVEIRWEISATAIAMGDHRNGNGWGYLGDGGCGRGTRGGVGVSRMISGSTSIGSPS